jgi:hypothetical protein
VSCQLAELGLIKSVSESHACKMLGQMLSGSAEKFIMTEQARYDYRMIADPTDWCGCLSHNQQ